MAIIKKEIRDRIIAQTLNELRFSRLQKQGKIRNWQLNENQYYAFKFSTDPNLARANVELGKMQGFVHTILSKIDSPLTFKFQKGEDADLKSAKRLNALREQDAKADNWDMKDLVGKKQAVIYGRAIYCYHADDTEGYKAHLENVDVYDFLVDPSGGGIDLERAFYMGRYGIVKTREQLKQGAKDGLYLRTETNNLLSGGSNNTETPQEVVNESNRYLNLGGTQNRELQDNDKFKFWEWYTTFEGERYYVLLTESAGTAVRIEKLADIFECNMWPFWSWAAFPDLTEFWTPSYCDYVREIFMAQSISINQMLDNAEQVNKPQKAINVNRITNFAEVKYKKNGYIKVTGDGDVNQAIQMLQVPSINTPIEVYNTLDNIQQVESGVNNGAKGVSEEDKVGIYEGNQANTADRFGLLNKSYSFGYKRFGILYYNWVKEKLTKKIAIQMIGIDGIEIEEIKAKDIKPTRTDYNIVVEASDAETQNDAIDKRNKLAFLSTYINNPSINQKVLFETQADIAGFNSDKVKELLDVENYGSAELMSEASRDTQRLISGFKVRPNLMANTAYKQKIVDYMRDHIDDLNAKQWTALSEYLALVEPIVISNMTRKMTNDIAEMGMGLPQPTEQTDTNLEIVEPNALPEVEQPATAMQ